MIYIAIYQNQNVPIINLNSTAWLHWKRAVKAQADTGQFQNSSVYCYGLRNSEGKLVKILGKLGPESFNCGNLKRLKRHYPRTRRKTASSWQYWSRFTCGGTHRWNFCCWWTVLGSCKGSDAGTTSLTPEKSKDFAPRPSTFVAFHSSSKKRRWRKTCTGKQRRLSRHLFRVRFNQIDRTRAIFGFEIQNIDDTSRNRHFN